MNCGKCPHMRKIEAALKPCANCDAGKLHGQVYIDTRPDPSFILTHAKPTDHTPQTGVTALAPDVEESLRIALATVFAFNPVEVLLLRHILAGGSYTSYRVPLRELRARLGRYDLDDDAPGFRSLAQTWAKRMEDKLPALKDLFKARIEETAEKSRTLRF